MTRKNRIRTSTETHSGSYANYATSLPIPPATTNTATIVLQSSISDQYGRPIVDGPLNSEQRRGVIRLDGYVIGSNNKRVEFNSFPVTANQGPSVDRTPLAAPDGWYLHTVAMTNPSRPDVTLPGLAQDMIELPGMIRQIGKLFTNRNRISRDVSGHVSATYLGIQFGWLPLLDDIRQLVDAQALILKRLKMLEGLRSGTGLHRRLMWESETSTYRQYAQYSTSAGIIRVDTSRDVIKRSWSTIRWRPTSGPSWSPSDESLNRKMRRIVYGLTPEGMLKGLWDVLPWTWFIGWFSNIGDYLLVTSNTVPAEHSGACFMSQVVDVQRFAGVSATPALKDNKVQGTGSQSYVHKTRIVSSGAPVAGVFLPFLGGFRLSILGALYTARFRNVPWLRLTG